MHITHINTYDIQGGAARATFRLHQGLQQLGVHSQMLVRYKQSSDRHVQAISPAPREGDGFVAGAFAIQQQYINENRTKLSNILFSFPYPGIDLTTLPAIQSASLIHLHWTANFQSVTTLHALLKLGKPVVWTLHDMFPFTGGCHSSAGCSNYQLGCGECPQLENDPYHLPRLVLQDKQDLLLAPNLTIVAPSHKMATFARQSQLFRKTRIEVIHHSIDTNIFYPLPKTEAKQKLGLSPEATIVAFGAEDGKQRSKGFHELSTVIRQCKQNAQVGTLLEAEKLCFICFGAPNPDIKALNVPLVEFGLIRSDETLRELYSAADVFLQPSLEESFGNMAIEALACGTPVIGFDVGVASEAIAQDKTGRVVPLGNVDAMTEAVIDFATKPKKWQSMQDNCSASVKASFSQNTQATAYLKLYQDLLGSQTDLEPQSIQPEPLLENANQSIYLSWDTTVGLALQPILPKITLESALKELQVTVEREEQLKTARERVKDLKAKLQTKQAEINRLTAELQTAHSEIEAMSSSKFWKIRTLWFKLRSGLGIATP